MKKTILFIFITITFLQANSFDNGMKYFKKGNYDKALPFFMKASKEGDKEAQFYLANMFEKGLGVRKDLKMASKLYKLYSSESKEKANIPIHALSKEKSETKTRSPIQKKVAQKNNIKRIKETTERKSYSKRLKKHFNPDIKAPQEVFFN